MAGGTPCGCRIRVRGGSLTVLMNHLMRYHAAEYSALMLQLELEQI